MREKSRCCPVIQWRCFGFFHVGMCTGWFWWCVVFRVYLIKMFHVGMCTRCFWRRVVFFKGLFDWWVYREAVSKFPASGALWEILCFFFAGCFVFHPIRWTTEVRIYVSCGVVLVSEYVSGLCKGVRIYVRTLQSFFYSIERLLWLRMLAWLKE